jgi:type I restriction enzyme S subunit
MSEWREVTIKYVLSDKGYIRGPFGSSLKRDEMYTHGIPVYEQKNAIYNERTFRFFINEKKFEELSRFQVKTNDIIISCSGTVGKVSIIKDEDPKGIISQALLILRPNVNKVELLYLYYFLSSRQGFELLTQASHGSVQINIAERKVVESIPLLLPPLPEQKAIAGVLSSLDDKIDLLSRQNKTLEAMAEALFRQWFVEEADEEWEEKLLGDLVTTVDNRGKTPPHSEDYSLYPVIEVNALGKTDRLVDYSVIKKYVDEETFCNWFRDKLCKYDILISTVGSIGALSMYIIEKGNIAQNVIGLHAEKISPFYLYQFIKYKINEIMQYDIGGVQPSIKVPHLLSIVVSVPPMDKQNHFDKAIITFINKMENNYLQIHTLEKLRDTLLPKLMSGDVRVVV